MRIGPEPLDGCYTELDVLLHDDLDQNKPMAEEGLPPRRMNWIAYIQLANAGSLVLVTARDDEDNNKLLGFVMYLIHPHLHHIGVVCAACDILVVAIGARSRGIAQEMMEVAEPILDSRGVRYVIHMSKVCYDVEPLFSKLGYRLLERSHWKELK